MSASKPSHTVLGILLDSRLQLRLVELEVIDCANSHDALAGEAARCPPHESSTLGAEEVGHGVAGLNCLVLLEFGEEIFAAGVGDGGVVDDEV